MINDEHDDDYDDHNDHDQKQHRLQSGTREDKAISIIYIQRWSPMIRYDIL